MGREGVLTHVLSMIEVELLYASCNIPILPWFYADVCAYVFPGTIDEHYRTASSTGTHCV